MVHPTWYWNSSVADFDHELDLLHAAGANAVRVDLSWAEIQPRQGTFPARSPYIDRFDTFLAHAQARQIKVLVTLMASPCWAAAAPASVLTNCQGPFWEYAPRSAADFATGAAWVAQRWGSQLAGLEIWNEPDQPGFLNGTPDPAATYAQMLKAAYPRVKAVAPNLPVVGGVLAGSYGEFLTRLYDLGIKGSYDALSIHPYNGAHDPDVDQPGELRFNFQAGVEWIHRIMEAHGDGNVPLWLTEFGFSTCSCFVSEAQQAQYTNASFRIAQRWSYVKALFVYSLRNTGTDDSVESQYGLVNRDFSPKPAYTAFADALAGRFYLPTAAPASTTPPPTQRPAPATKRPRDPTRLASVGITGRRDLALRIFCPRACGGSSDIANGRSGGARAGVARHANIGVRTGWQRLRLRLDRGLRGRRTARLAVTVRLHDGSAPISPLRFVVALQRRSNGYVARIVSGPRPRTMS